MTKDDKYLLRQVQRLFADKAITLEQAKRYQALGHNSEDRLIITMFNHSISQYID